jgi:hypothetical protein
MSLYGGADSRRIWSYAVFSLAAPLAATALLAFFAVATFFPVVFPVALHPATASKQVLYIECCAICLAVGLSVEHKFRRLRDEVASLAMLYWRPVDRVKWCLMTLLGIGSIAVMVLLAVGWYR